VQVAAAQQEPNVRHGSVVAKPEQRFGVVVGRFNDLVTKLLLEGAKGAFQAHGVSMSNVEVGSTELCWIQITGPDTSAPQCLRPVVCCRARTAGAVWYQAMFVLLHLFCAVRCAGYLAALSCPLWPRLWPSPASLMQWSALVWW